MLEQTSETGVEGVTHQECEVQNLLLSFNATFISWMKIMSNLHNLLW